MDSINRHILDFDFEKLCSVSNVKLNVYAPCASARCIYTLSTLFSKAFMQHPTRTARCCIMTHPVTLRALSYALHARTPNTTKLHYLTLRGW
jgi:hypothetical protein